MIKPLYSKRGSARVGKSYTVSMKCLWPFACINLYQDFFTITLFGIQKIKLHYDQVESVRTRWEKTLFIKHQTKQYPFILFRSAYNSNLITFFRNKGIKIRPT